MATNKYLQIGYYDLQDNSDKMLFSLEALRGTYSNLHFSGAFDLNELYSSLENGVELKGPFSLTQKNKNKNNIQAIRNNRRIHLQNTECLSQPF